MPTSQCGVLHGSLDVYMVQYRAVQRCYLESHCLCVCASKAPNAACEGDQ